MKLNDVVLNREAFDLAEHAILAESRESLLRLLGPRTPGPLRPLPPQGGPASLLGPGCSNPKALKVHKAGLSLFS